MFYMNFSYSIFLIQASWILSFLVKVKFLLSTEEEVSLCERGTKGGIEQKALDVLDAIRESKGITQAELGRRAFPDDAAPHMRIRALRVEKNGKKQRLRLGDFRALCVALDEDPIRVLIKAWEDS